MSSHPQLPKEKPSDDDLVRGFSFAVRQANTQGQFSGPTPKSIVPGVQTAARTRSTTQESSSPQRLTLPFRGQILTSNPKKNVSKLADSTSCSKDALLDSANRIARASSRLSHRTYREESLPEEAIPPVKAPTNSYEMSVQADDQNYNPPSQAINKQPLGRPSIQRHTQVSSGRSKDTSNSPANLSRDNSRFKEYLHEDYIQSRTQPQRCGDLEGYGIYGASNATPTPSSHRRTVSRNHDGVRPFDFGSSVSRRTHSRTSNISRKRAISSAYHQASEPDRKRLAMSQAVKHRNECIQITTEESDRARSTIHNLKKKLQRQANELQAAHHALEHGDSSLRTLQKEYKELKEKDTRESTDKTGLEVKYNELNGDYEKLRSQIKEMSTKYSLCKTKLDDTISEQRKLVDSSSTTYNAIKAQMEREEAAREADATSLLKAMQTSEHKRDELKKIVDLIKNDFQHQKVEYEQRIISLERENGNQYDQIDSMENDKEKLYDELISSRSTKTCIENVDSKLGNFVTQLRRLDASQDTAAIELVAMKTRVDDLPDRHDFAALKEQVSESHNRIENLEKMIRDSLLSAIKTVASKQVDSDAGINSLATAVKTGFAKIQNQIQTHGADINQTIKSGRDCWTEVSNSLKLISAAEGDVSSRVEIANGRLENVLEAISSRGVIGSSIATILGTSQAVSESNDKIMVAHDKFREEGQKQHQLISKQMDTKSLEHDAVLRELIGSLRQHIEAILKENSAPQNSKVVKGDKPTILNRNMISDVEAVRSNLRQVELQLSKIDDVPSSLQKIYDLSLLIQETSKYMNKEEQWVRQTIGDRVLHSDASVSTNSPTSQQSISQSSSSTTGYGSGSRETTDDSVETQIRKVIVHSPVPRVDSPLPVTAAQEQRRRREHLRPRSILKQTQNKASASKGLVASASSSSHTSNEAVANICSSVFGSPLPGPPSSHRTTALTSMTEYLKLNPTTNARSVGVVGDLADAEPAAAPVAAASALATVV